jgi:hypothetical protein
MGQAGPYFIKDFLVDTKKSTKLIGCNQGVNIGGRNVLAYRGHGLLLNYVDFEKNEGQVDINSPFIELGNTYLYVEVLADFFKKKPFYKKITTKTCFIFYKGGV